MIKLECKHCGKGFERYKSQLVRPGRGKYCSRACTSVQRLKRTNTCRSCGVALSNRRGTNRPSYCRKHFAASEGFIGRTSATWFKPNNAPANKGNAHLPNEKNPAWKGVDVGYGALHSWVRRQLGTPSKCTLCGTSDEGKRYEWANVSRTYRRDLTDWIRLCKKCHNDYDGVNAWQNKAKAADAV